VFLGEGPGESEDLIGYPFVGPAGRLLDEMIKDAKDRISDFWQSLEDKALREFGWEERIASIRIAMMNVVGCIPLKEGAKRTDGASLREPKKDEAIACHPRVIEELRMIDPYAVLAVGDTALRLHPKEYGVENIPHPSYLLRISDQKQYHNLYKKCVIKIRNLLLTVAYEKDIPF